MERTVAKVAVSRAVYAIDKPYDYLVPDDLAEELLPGMRVAVPFGAGNRSCDGIVLSLAADCGDTPLKAILFLLDDQPVLDAKGIQLALWMRERYFCTLYDAVKAMLPAGLYFSLRDCLTIAPGMDRDRAFSLVEDVKPASDLVQVLVSLGGKGDMGQIRAAFGSRSPAPAIQILLDRGVAVWQTDAQRAVGDKTERLAVLKMPAEEAMSLVTPRRKSAPLRYAVVELLCTLGCASSKELCYFTGATSSTLKSLEKSGIISLERQEVLRRVTLDDVQPAPPLQLNEEQEQAFQRLDGLCRRGEAGAALLYGVTGSGKTQVYIRLIQQTLLRGRTALVLVPEISLTPQLLRIFTSYFGAAVAVLHSSLRSGERYDEWKRVRSGQATVVLGTRSAVFAPLQHLGLIVLDEEQESSYKSENAPRYHARDVAKYRCVQNHAVLLLGSATPSVETMYAARSGTYQDCRLAKRYNERALPEVCIVDMKQELRAGNGTSISARLRGELEQNMARGEQSILFLNRRGANRMVSCGECGEVPTCPRCSFHLTYHSANGRLMCHFCGHSQPLPAACPTCGGGLNFIGVGTQRVQEELQELFPDVEVLRMDTDAISAAHPHEELLSRFIKQRIPILVGTQMVAKGLDFENVTLVGVVAADMALYVDDFRAGERTFSLITQVVGRAGRGGKQGRALIQTYTPEHDVIRFAACQDYDRFYEQEIALRQLRGYPPFQDIVVFTASGLDEAGVLRACTKLRQALEQGARGRSLTFQLLGPAPAAVTKINNRFRYCLTLLGRADRPLRLLIAGLLRAVQQDRENRGVSIFADINPLN